MNPGTLSYNFIFPCYLSGFFRSCAQPAFLFTPNLQAAVKAPPNVVFITIDTLRADHLGCYGYKQIQTPNIDALAAHSARFEHAYTPVPVTLPAHTAIFTGTYPTLSGMHDFSGNKLNPTQATLASILKEHGYATAAVIGSAVLDSRFGLNQGFDFYYDHFDFNRLQESNLEEMERPGNIVADVTLDWLGKNYKSAFFYGCTFTIRTIRTVPRLPTVSNTKIALTMEKSRLRIRKSDD